MGIYARRGGPKARGNAPRRAYRGKKSRRTRKVPRRLYRRKAKVSLGKLLDSKINTIYEKRAKEIAQKAIEKSKVNLVMRKKHGEYFPDRNYWKIDVTSEDDADQWKRTDLYLSGFSQELANIPFQTIEMASTGVGGPARPDNDEKMTEIPEHEVYGANVTEIGKPKLPEHGTRTKNSVLLRSFFVKMRLLLAESNTSSSQLSKVRVHYAIVRASVPWVQLGNNNQVTGEASVNQLLPFRNWQQHSILDDGLRAVQRDNGFKFKTLAKGMTTLWFRDQGPDEKFATISYKFPKPKLNEYHDLASLHNDIIGENPKVYKYYFVVRSELGPQTTDDDGNVVPDSGYLPRSIPQIHWVTYTNYYDS